MKLFRFKKFEIIQENAGMKLTTDAVMFGSWIETGKSKNMLDIGTGTGILALMMAQRCENSKITAIDIDRTAIFEAKRNVENSKWVENIELLQADFLDFVKNTNQRFDLIICNPPYYEEHLLSKNQEEKKAKHSTNLNYEQLISNIYKILENKGEFALIAPFFAYEKINFLCNKNMLFCKRKCVVKSEKEKTATRVMLQYSVKPYKTIDSELVVKSNNQYTKEFLQLTSEFYIFA